MRVTILQSNIEWCKPSINIKKAELMMDSSEPCDLYVLPEMWSTGFVVSENCKIEKEETSLALSWMRKIAVKKKAAVCGSLAIKTIKNGTTLYYNRQYFITPQNTEYYYDKHHLFTLEKEDKLYSAGNTKTIAQWKGFKFRLLTCYDLRFPKWSRYENDYDAIIVTANWPQNRGYAWEILTKARAIENQAYVIAANRVGRDLKTIYCGKSQIIDPLGNILAVGPVNNPQNISADLSLDTLNNIRNTYPFLKDKD